MTQSAAIITAGFLLQVAAFFQHGFASESGPLKIPNGFSAEKFIGDLTYPTSIEFDEKGNIYIAEAGYSYGDDDPTPRILHRDIAGKMTTFVSDGLSGPVNDLLWHNGRLFVSHRGRISYVSADRKIVDIVTDLPSLGDHHNNQLAADEHGRLYVGQGTFTNAGVVGPDNASMGWLEEHPDLHDLPARDIVLRGQAFESANPLDGDEDRVRTSAYHSFGVTAAPGARVRAVKKANGTILSFKDDGSDLRIVASGLRNPYGLIFGENGRLFATENGMDERGSRPVANDLEDLYVIKEGAWYGWPDFGSGVPITDSRFKPDNAAQPEFLLREHPAVQKPLATFPKHSSITKLDVSRSSAFGEPGDLFIAFFGHMTPMTGTAPEEHGGHRVVRVNPASGDIKDFVIMHHGGGHDSNGRKNIANQDGGGRFMDVRFSRDGREMYIVDFGVMNVTAEGPKPARETGVVWRIEPKSKD